MQMKVRFGMAWWWYPYAWGAVLAVEAALLLRIPITEAALDRLEAHLAAKAVRAIRVG